MNNFNYKVGDELTYTQDTAFDGTVTRTAVVKRIDFADPSMPYFMDDGYWISEASVQEAHPRDYVEQLDRIEEKLNRLLRKFGEEV